MHCSSAWQLQTGSLSHETHCRLSHSRSRRPPWYPISSDSVSWSFAVGAKREANR